MTYNINNIHIYELDVGTRFGKYKVIQSSRSTIHAEDIRTGEISRFEFISGKLVHADKY